MKFDFDKIIRLQNIRTEISKLSEEEKRLITPLFTDKNLIPVIHDIFAEITNEMNQENVDSVIQRKKFIFIIMYMFSPNALAGGKMRKGIRDEISKVTRCSTTLISHNCEDIVFIYNFYDDFRKDVEIIYKEIINRLLNRGLIK